MGYVNFNQLERSSPWVLPTVQTHPEDRGERPMSRREYARRNAFVAQLRRIMNAAAVLGTCAAAALVGTAI